MDNTALEVIAADTKPVLFDTKTPKTVIERAKLIANTLTPLVEQAKLYSMINGRKYVTVDGWNTMLSMLGVFPAVEYSRKLERENETCYEARVNLTTLEGKVVGSGEAICSSKERNWANRDEFAIKSMAQTRATGKAARIGFSWIMKLAGYEPTPAEEMIHDAQPVASAPKPEPVGSTHPGDTPQKHYISDKQRKRLYAIWKNAGKADAEVSSHLLENYQLTSTKEITSDIYEDICLWAEQGK